MNLSVFEKDQLVKYDVTYDRTAIMNFLKSVINNYGFFRDVELKLSNEHKISQYCDEYRNLKVVKAYEDNTKIHKGRKRVLRKDIPRKYLFSITEVDYPEIYHTIINFLSQRKVDFTMFSKYLNTDVECPDLDYYIEEGYRKYQLNAVEELKKSLDTDDKKREYMSQVKGKRILQSKCLEEFYNLLVFDCTQSIDAVNGELLYLYNALSFHTAVPFTPLHAEKCLTLASQYIRGNPIPRASTPAEVRQAQGNREILEKINNTSLQKVKTLEY